MELNVKYEGKKGDLRQGGGGFDGGNSSLGDTVNFMLCIFCHASVMVPQCHMYLSNTLQPEPMDQQSYCSHAVQIFASSNFVMIMRIKQRTL